MPTLQRQVPEESPLVAQIAALEPAAPWTPEHDLTVGEREVRLSVDLPGVAPQNLHVVLHAGRLWVYGHRVPARAGASTRRTGRFALDVEVPAWVDARRVFRTHADGILTVVLPRCRESRPSAHAA